MFPKKKWIERKNVFSSLLSNTVTVETNEERQSGFRALGACANECIRHSLSQASTQTHKANRFTIEDFLQVLFDARLFEGARV